MSKIKLTAAESLMAVSHQTIARLRSMVPELIKQRDEALKQSEHFKSQAMMLSDMAIPVALENQRLTARVKELEAMLKLEVGKNSSEFAESSETQIADTAIEHG